MRYCPFFYNPYYDDMYENAYEEDETEEMYRDYYEEEDELDMLSEEEELEYYDETMRQAPAQDINRIMGLADTQLGYLYNELQRHGINRNTSRYFFRTIVSYTVNNASKYTGTTEQRATAILNDFTRQYPWIFYLMRANGITQERANQIVRAVIVFTLTNLSTQPQPSEDLEQRATRITNLIRQQSDVFTRLQNLGVTASAANTFVRTVVLYVLRNSNPNQAPANLETRTAELVRAFEAANPSAVRELQNLGIPLGQIRVLLRSIILFTLRNIYSREIE